MVTIFKPVYQDFKMHPLLEFRREREREKERVKEREKDKQRKRELKRERNINRERERNKTQLVWSLYLSQYIRI